MIVAARLGDLHSAGSDGHGFLSPARETQAPRLDQSKGGTLGSQIDRTGRGPVLIEHAQRVVQPAPLAEDLGQQAVAARPTVPLFRSLGEQPGHGRLGAIQALRARLQVGDHSLPVSEQQGVGDVVELAVDALVVSRPLGGRQ